jgi:ferredoxin-NADP reductase
MRSKLEWVAATVTETKLLADDVRMIEFAWRGATPRFEPGSHTNVRVRIGDAAATRTRPAGAGRASCGGSSRVRSSR